MTKIYFGSDHAGLELKSKLVMFLQEPQFAGQYEVHDMGPQSTESVDYPDFADLVCKKLHGFSLINSNHVERSHPLEVGVLICGSGQGMAMRANKYPQIRAALCWSLEIARLSREHNDANVICFGARVSDHQLCQEMLTTFLKTPFAGGRHWQRLVKVSTPV